MRRVVGTVVFANEHTSCDQWIWVNEPVEEGESVDEAIENAIDFASWDDRLGGPHRWEHTENTLRVVEE